MLNAQEKQKITLSTILVILSLILFGLSQASPIETLELFVEAKGTLG